MGQILPKRRQRSVVVVGLDGSGKTSLIASLKSVQEKCISEAQEMGMKDCRTFPTSVLQLIEYNTRDFDRNMRPERCSWQIWDMSGQGKHRPLWHLYAGQVDGIVFVIDMCDAERLSIVHRELKLLLTCDRVRSRVKPVAVAFCLNKANIASESEEEVLNEEEVRRGIAYDDYQGVENVELQPWHCGEDLNAALDTIARHASSLK